MTRIAALISFILIAVATAIAAGRSVADIPNVHVSDRSRYVSNPDGVLSERAERQLNNMLAGLWERTSAEVVMVAVADIDRPDDIDGFATDLFEEWGIGKSDRDNGLLILVARDSRKAVIRTGQGMEGVLPDIVAGRILRNKMFPLFREGNYDGGVMAATQEVGRVVSDPQYAEELRSKYANDSRANRGSDFDGEEFFNWYLKLSAIVGVGAFLLVIFVGFRSRHDDIQIRWRRLSNLRLPLLFLTALCLAMPLPALLVAIWRMKAMRSRPRKCPNCATRMNRLDEETDNKYLTPAQDAEERYNSVDYDVWLCPNCGETDIIPFVNRHTTYAPCERCGARLSTLTEDRTLVRPTQRSEGRGVRTFTCLSCGHRKNVPYSIAKLAVPPVVIIPGGGGGGFGGGGFSGGSFGGGSTMGGGASGSW